METKGFFKKHMDETNPKNLRGFTDRFAEGFAIPQINFWLENIFQIKPGMAKLEASYYYGMEKAGKDLLAKFSLPYSHNSVFPLHEVVINVEEVEILKGIIGDNYNFLRKTLADKEELGVSFVDTKEEKEALENLDLYLNHVVPNFLDSLQRSFFIPFEAITRKSESKKEKENLDVSATKVSGIFLCHSSKDAEIVRWFRNSLEGKGLKVWFDESEILPGDSIVAKISDGMKKAEYVILFVSENLNLENISPYVGWELSMAKIKDLEDTKGRLIPAMIGGSSEIAKLPQEVADKNYADFRDIEELSMDNPEFLRLLKKINS